MGWAARRFVMTIYISQGRYTREAIQGMVNNPEDRTEAVRALCESAGARLIAHYITLGEYDFLAIIEADGPATNMLAALFAVAATGGVTDLKTTMAMSSGDAKPAMEKAQTMMKGFRPAGRRG
jgi:uncharacterized protein with GYD domain